MSQKTKFAAAAKACRGISSRTKRNACVRAELYALSSPHAATRALRRHVSGRIARGEAEAIVGIPAYGSPQGRRHRGGGRRRHHNPLKG